MYWSYSVDTTVIVQIPILPGSLYENSKFPYQYKQVKGTKYKSLRLCKRFLFIEYVTDNSLF